ncbi:hypothetical protein AVEN_189335-1 [Araneus ventricosus]|uniref:Uncharacterized protein n=1 Tax=Araneus ventricosus TaxID=182803 RepID=A0A4Y2LYA5_ARAVE|nr:hypothetical protein AVEN_189335-1 [Araneus ventricosus]
MVAVKIVLRLYYDKDIERTLEAKEKVPISLCCFDREKKELWNQIEMKAAEKLPCLPDSLKSKVSEFIRPFQSESVYWSRDHKRLLGLSGTDCYLTYKRILCWKGDETIDRMQTAKKFAQDGNMDPETRFAVACTYFLEDEVLVLWHGDEEVNMRRLARNRINAAVRFWIKLLKKGSWRKTPWKAMVDRYFKIPHFRRLDVPLRVSCFFTYLSREGRRNYFVFLRENKVYPDDYCLCMQAMDETERMELVSSHPGKSLQNCLYWPFQSLFIEMVNRLWSHMDTVLFDSLLHNIICFCIFPGLDDFDYVGLFKEF